MKTKFFLSILLLLAVLCDSHAQADHLPTPPSLNAQSFLQNIHHPVSYHTGTVNVEIPIYTMELKDISIPISLGYNTSGIKVEQEASTVGLGWVLNAGGAITKTIMGENDLHAEHTYFNTDCDGGPHLDCNSINDITGIAGPISHSFTLTDYLESDSAWRYFLNATSVEEGYNALMNGSYYDHAGGKEFAPDIFNYSFGPYSGTFVFKRDKTIVKEKEDDVIITPIFSYSDGCIDDISSWEAVTPDGTRYVFDKAEEVRFWNYHTCNNCWHLTKIETINKTIVEFTYVEGQMQYRTFNRYQESGPDGINNGEQIKYNNYDQCYYLKSISSGGQKLDFAYVYDRSDAVWLPRLSTVERYSEDIKMAIWEMKQSYFVSNASTSEKPTVSRLQQLGMAAYGYDSSWNRYRLKLHEVLSMPADRTDTLKYSLEYNETNLPTKLSTAMDHWGYFNGRDNGSLIGKQYHMESTPDGARVSHGGSADRSVYDNYNQAYMLERIIYPTGGYTDFDYESNEYDTANMEGDPHKADYYHEQASASVYEGEGYHNVPGSAVSSTEVYIPSGDSRTRDVVIHYKVTLNPEWYNLYYTHDMSLTLSLAGWNKVLIAPELPSRGNLSNENCVFEGRTTFNIHYGTHQLQITGSLRKVMNEALLEVSWETDDYVSRHPVSKGGGLRIKEMKTYEEPGKCSLRKCFGYESGSKSTGKLMSYPRYNTGYLTYSSNCLRNPGYSVGYSKVNVTELDTENNSNGRIEYEFINRPDSNYCYSWESTLVELDTATGYSYDANPTGVMAHRYPQNGTLLTEKHYDSSGNKVKEVINSYVIRNEQKDIVWGIAKETRNINGSDASYLTNEEILANSDVVGPPTGIPMGYLYPSVQPTQVWLTSSDEYVYEGASSIHNHVSYTHDYEHYPNFVRSSITNKSDGTVIKTDYMYPFDFSSLAMETLTEKNIIDSPVQTTTYVNGMMTRKENTDYSFFDNQECPRVSVKRYKTMNGGSDVITETVHSYDSCGNPQWITVNGLDIVYIWGYMGQYPIAEIRNASLDEVTSALGSQAASVFSSLSSIMPSDEVMAAIEDLKSDNNDFMIKTFTYAYGSGVSSMSDERGVKIRYFYDSFGRLTKITEQTSPVDQENMTAFYLYNSAK